MSDDRVTRLSERFQFIRTALAEVTQDEDLAFAAASVAYLEVVDFLSQQGLQQVARRGDTAQAEMYKSLVSEMQSGIRLALKFYHRQLCEFLEVDQVEAIKHSKAFKEIVDDICRERG